MLTFLNTNSYTIVTEEKQNSNNFLATNITQIIYN